MNKEKEKEKKLTSIKIGEIEYNVTKIVYKDDTIEYKFSDKRDTFTAKINADTKKEAVKKLKNDLKNMKMTREEKSKKKEHYYYQEFQK